MDLSRRQHDRNSLEALFLAADGPNWKHSDSDDGRSHEHPALLVVDEIGYLSVTPNGARLFFQLVNARYGRASTVLTSNKGFEHWGEILHDEVMAAALLDRLLHRCHIVNIRGNSFRMRRHMELSRAIHPIASRAADAEKARKGGESWAVAVCAIFDARKCAISMPIDMGGRFGWPSVIEG